MSSQTLIARGDRYALTSYAHGLAYSLDDTLERKSVFVGGDDASVFRGDWESYGIAAPDWPVDDVLARLWADYT